MNKQVTVEPGTWPDVVEQIGLGGAVVLILALSAGTAFILRGPAIIEAFNSTLKIILTHRRKSQGLPEVLEQKKTNTRAAIQKKGGKP